MYLFVRFEGGARAIPVSPQLVVQVNDPASGTLESFSLEGVQELALVADVHAAYLDETSQDEPRDNPEPEWELSPEALALADAKIAAQPTPPYDE